MKELSLRLTNKKKIDNLKKKKPLGSLIYWEEPYNQTHQENEL
jgi:hypothetical protein